jgi:predicted Fe-Mo cluster-binding NifX family protein
MYKVAIASSEGVAVDLHFGQADAFGIYSVDPDTGKAEFVEWRQATESAEGCGCVGAHDGDFLRLTAERLRDCVYVLVSRIGGRANAALAAHGLHVIEAAGDVATALNKLNRYYRLQHRTSLLSPAGDIPPS